LITSLRAFLRLELRPRLREVIVSSEFLLALFITVAAVYGGFGNGLLQSSVGDVITPLLTYAAIVLGFTLGSTALALTFPDGKFTKSLIRRRNR